MNAGARTRRGLSRMEIRALREQFNDLLARAPRAVEVLKPMLRYLTQQKRRRKQ